MRVVVTRLIMRLIVLYGFLLICGHSVCAHRNPRREWSVTVLERSAKDSTVKPYVGPVEYHLATFCEGENRSKLIANGFSGPSETSLPWYPDAECACAPTRVKYALLVDWMRCVPASGIETVDVRDGHPHLTITVQCDR